MHYNDSLHSNCDFIYNDVVFHSESNDKLKSVADYFENYLSLEYSKFIYNLIEEKIDNYLTNFNGKLLHISNLPRDEDLYQFENLIDLSHITDTHPGLMNHLSDEGNIKQFKIIDGYINVTLS